MLISKLGRKGTMMGASVFFALSYLCLAAAQNVWMLLAGRYLCGLSTGITAIVTPTYVSETVSPHVRGMMGTCFQLMINIGFLYMDVVGVVQTLYISFFK
jgi:MFS family permease